MSEKTAAFLDGWFAHKNDREVEENPYSELMQPFSHTQWASGWCSRFNACKHDLDLTYDEDLL